MPPNGWHRRARVSRWSSCTRFSMRSRSKCSPRAEGRTCFRSTGSRSRWLHPLARCGLGSRRSFDGSPTLRDRVLDRLHGVGCDVTNLSAKVSYVSKAAADWQHPQFRVEFVRVPQVSPSGPPSPQPKRRLELAVVSGTVETSASSFTQTRTDIGRCAEVRDDRHRLIRTNHVVFSDDGKRINESVSRCHAHVAYQESSGDYRVYDDRSAHGTGVLRNGRTIIVAPGTRGVRLQSGDEIVLGEARLRVTVT